MELVSRARYKYSLWWHSNYLTSCQVAIYLRYLWRGNSSGEYSIRFLCVNAEQIHTESNISRQASRSLERWRQSLRRCVVLPTRPKVCNSKNYQTSRFLNKLIRLSRCTCPGESHPGPVHSDGTYVGRAAPEIDIFEAQVILCDLFLLQRLIKIQVDGNLIGQVSQSAQWAVCGSFRYMLKSSLISFEPSRSTPVTNGSIIRKHWSSQTQQERSSTPTLEVFISKWALGCLPLVTLLIIIYRPLLVSRKPVSGFVLNVSAAIWFVQDQNCYEKSGSGCFSVYGFEYKPGV